MASSSLGQCLSKAEHPNVFIGIVGGWRKNDQKQRGRVEECLQLSGLA